MGQIVWVKVSGHLVWPGTIIKIINNKYECSHFNHDSISEAVPKGKIVKKAKILTESAGVY